MEPGNQYEYLFQEIECKLGNIFSRLGIPQKLKNKILLNDQVWFVIHNRDEWDNKILRE